MKSLGLLFLTMLFAASLQAEEQAFSWSDAGSSLLGGGAKILAEGVDSAGKSFAGANVSASDYLGTGMTGAQRRWQAKQDNKLLQGIQNSLKAPSASGLLEAAKGDLTTKTKGLYSYCKSHSVPIAAQAVSVTDTVSATVGFLSAGDASGAAGEILDNSVKGLIAGAGAAAGGAIGSFIPIPGVGTAAGVYVGGAVGSFAASLTTSGAYDKYLSPYIKNIPALLAGDGQDPVVQAWIAKHGDELKKLEAGYGRQSGFDNAALVNSGDKELELAASTSHLAAMAVFALTPQGTQEAKPPAVSDAGTGKPVIPIDCTIEAIAWSPESAQYKGYDTYQILDGKVTGVSRSSEFNSPGCSTFRYEGTFTGSIRDNVISGRSDLHTGDILCNINGCRSVSRVSESASEVELTLNIDGTLSGSVIGGSSSGEVRKYACGDQPAGVYPYSHTVSPRVQLTGTWKIVRKAEN